MNDHTPGPWDHWPSEQWRKAGHKQPSSICHIGDYTIVTDSPSYEFHASDENDARLIAAAPALFDDGLFLLERLDEFESEIIENDELGREWCGHVAPALARFRAAILKATGKKSL